MTRPVQKRLSSAIALALCVPVVLSSATSFAQPRRSAPTTEDGGPAQPQDLIAKGHQLFEDQQYEDSIQTLSAALLRPSNTKAQKVEIYRLLALNYITLGRTDEADSAVRGLLVAEPTYELPASESPRFRDFFASARERWEEEGRPGFVVEKAPEKPVSLRHGSPASAEKDRPIALRAKLEDPGDRALGVRLYYRAGTRGAFTEEAATVEGDVVRVRIPGEAVKPPVMDYYFEAYDASGAVIASRGDAQAPLRVAVPDGGGSGWVVPVAIGGGLLGAAAIVGGLALAGVFKGSSAPPPGTGPGGRDRNTSTVTVNVGEAGLRW